MRKSNKSTLAVIASVIILVVFEIISYLTDSERVRSLEVIVTRLIGGIIFAVLIREKGYAVFRISSEDRKTAFCVTAAAVIVAVNNFPFIGILSGRAQINGSNPEILLLFFEALAVGIFEELAFRGFLIPLLGERLKRRSNFRLAVYSSLIFGAVHIVNLFVGASPAAVLLQVGYSFCIGGMCASVLLYTGSVWVCAVIHAVYNFGGSLVPRLGSGSVWDSATVIETAFIGICAAGYILYVLLTEDSRKNCSDNEK